MLPPDYTQPQPIVPNKKPTSVFSWLGFGLSLGTLLIIIIACILTALGDDGRILMISIMGCFLTGLLGFIFSIIGLIMAIKNCTPKWMSISGIISCCLCLFAPVIIAIFACAMEPNKKAQPDKGMENCTISDKYYGNYD